MFTDREDPSKWAKSSLDIYFGDQGQLNGLLIQQIHYYPVFPELDALGDIKYGQLDDVSGPWCVVHFSGVEPIDYYLPLANLGISRFSAETLDGHYSLQAFRLDYD